MKVLLIDNVKDIGKRGAIVTVADGLARNKLIPLKKAVEATPANIAKHQHITNNTSAETANGLPPKVVEILKSEEPLTLSARSDSHGSLYKAIHERDILAAVHSLTPAHLRPLVLQTHIIIPSPIKKTGKHTIKLADTTFTISVISE